MQAACELQRWAGAHVRVLIVGDSQAAGPVGSYVLRALRSEGWEAERIAHVGHGASDWARMHWEEYLAALRDFEPDHVLLIFGGNDRPDSALERAMRQFQLSGPEVWYAGPPRYDGRATPYGTVDLQARSARLRSLAAQVFKRRHLDAYPYTGLEVPRARDQVHFGEEGAAAWGAGIVRDFKRRRRASTVWTAALAGVILGGLTWWAVTEA